MVLKRAGRIAGVVAGLGISAVACKDGVVPGDSYKLPYVVRARLRGAVPAGSHPIATVIWTDPLQRTPDVQMPPRSFDSSVKSAVAAIEAGGDPETVGWFDVSFFRPPPPEAVVEIPSPGGRAALMALGELVIIDDKNDDGKFEIDSRGTIAGAAPGNGAPRDGYLAGSRNTLVYLVRPFPQDGTPPLVVPGTQTGYHLQTFVCQGRALMSVDPTDYADLEPQTGPDLVERRFCMRTHSP